jgi:hypothetical protein
LFLKKEVVMSVFVLGKDKKPLMPCSERRARILLNRKRARVHKLYPFTIRLVDRKQKDCVIQPVEIKLDPGSITTGIGVVRKDEDNDEVINVLFEAELTHRGSSIHAALTSRSAKRRRRRGCNLRYRPARFNNRTKPKGWLPPSLRHRIETTLSWVNRLCRLSPSTSIACELARFDMQMMEDATISGTGYQQGTLAGYEIREYLLEKWERKCAYCGKEGVPLQIEHIEPKSKGGSNRISNLCIACEECNQSKGSLSIEEFLKKRPVTLKKIKAQQKSSLRDAAAVNSTRKELVRCLETTGLVVTTATGGKTKFNRSQLGIPKTHALDAVCVGNVESVSGWNVPTLAIKSTGRGTYQRTQVDKYGFCRGQFMRTKRVLGFATGDIVRAIVPSGKYAGTHIGRVAVRAAGKFDIKTASGLVQSIKAKHCTIVQRGDGYGYSWLFTCVS